MTLFGTYISFQFLVTQYLQTLSGWSALSTALAFLPAGVMVVVLSTRMAPLLAIVTAVVDAGGAGRLASAPATLAAYRPALLLITGVAAIGALVALSGLRSRPALAGSAAALQAATVPTEPEFAEDCTAM